MLDAEVRTLLDLMDKAVQEGRPKLHTLPYTVGRAEVDKKLEDGEADPPEVAAVEDGSLAGPAGKIGYRRYRPLGSPDGPLPTLIYFHGGGFVAGTLETHDSTCRRLANKSRCQDEGRAYAEQLIDGGVKTTFVARYSILSSSFGSTQMPLCAMRLVRLRISGVRRFAGWRRGSASSGNGIPPFPGRQPQPDHHSIPTLRS
ncbi:alpha/beta hydrolase [Bradyrhizobium sp. BRP22]|nr:alpha/beta hydrolase [Bradyrhizobium sp. BRP22]